MQKETQSAGYWLGLIGKIILAVAMLIYLGKHSLNFFMWTFQGEDELFAWLGLMTTSIGALIWLAIFKWSAQTNWEKAIAMIMMFISLLGEFAVAGFDMYMNITGQITQTQWTKNDLHSMSFIVAGLALINGIALVADVAGMDILTALRKKDEMMIPAPDIFQTVKKESTPHNPPAPQEGAGQSPFRPNGD